MGKHIALITVIYFLVHLSNEEINKYAFMVYRKKQKLLQMEKNLMMQLLTRDFRQRRVDQLQRLKEWENQINETTQGKPPVKIENNVDLDEPPVGFTYVTQCKVKESEFSFNECHLMSSRLLIRHFRLVME